MKSEFTQAASDSVIDLQLARTAGESWHIYKLVQLTPQPRVQLAVVALNCFGCGYLPTPSDRTDNLAGASPATPA